MVAPVRRQVHHQPVYFLIFLTADPHGFWVFGVAAAKAREKWLTFLGPDESELEGMLFNTVADQIEREHATAIGKITENIRALCADGADVGGPARRPRSSVRCTARPRRRRSRPRSGS